MQKLARRWQSWHWLASPVGALLILVATACSNGKTPGAGADTSADTGLPFNVDGMVNGDSQADDTSDVDSSALGDLAYDTAGPLDAPNYDVVANCPGGALCPCSANTDCQSGLCLEDPSVEGGKACAQACKPDCAKGYVCANLTSGTSDIQQFCVYQAARLCDPCSSSKDCEVVGLVDSKCLDQGGIGRFCGVACVQDGDCPADYDCQQVGAVEGGKFKQCVRTPAKGSGAAFGECTCSASAVQKQLSTTCYGDDGAGAAGAKCLGVRTCGTSGLSVCNAPSPATETCDGADNDCDGETDEATCDDQLPCTEDVCDGKGSCSYSFVSGPGCDLAKGCTQVSDNGKPCEADNSLCTQGDVCSNGVCVVGTAVQCDDGNPCTVDGCDKKTGQCTVSAVDDGVPCNDGTKCTEKDACKAGVCKGKAVGCDDDNACTDDVCDPQLGCQISKLTGAPCSDDNPCTVGDLCADGQCKGGTPKECSSADPCVTSKCSPVDGKCKLGEAAAGTACDDGNGCTTGETCGGGVCQGGANNCGCQTDQDCAAQEDGSLCNGTLYCDKGKLPFVCKVKAGSVVKCDTSGDGECSTTTCAPATGACENVAAADGKVCDADGSVCSEGDACAGGKCSAGKAKNCDDGNVCTDDGCDPVVGCKKAGNSKPCDDGNACTGADGCSGGTCSGVPMNPVSDCGDGNPCTNDACDPKVGCTHSANQAQCDDGSPCTVGDVCAGSQCVSGANQCSCQSDKDCAAQEDGDLCNGTLVCDKGKLPYVCVVAVKTVVACDLSKDTTCSATVCSAKSGACEKVLAADGKGCDADGSVCTVGDACAAGECVAGAMADCDDKNACTQDSCDGKKGCILESVPVGTQCAGGNCVGSDCVLQNLAATATSIAAGYGHTCLLDGNGAVKCWGSNQYGQLGNGTLNSQAKPVAVQQMGLGATLLAAGGATTCAVDATNTLMCWGRNNQGQLGNATKLDASVPSAVLGLAAKVVSVSVGGEHVCAIVAGGTVYCWGDNSFGQLGDGTQQDSQIPAAVSSLLPAAKAISAGPSHTCALDSAGGAWCWGSNGNGQLGDGSVKLASIPSKVTGLGLGLKGISAHKGYSCAITAVGALQCWGVNQYGQLGTGTMEDSLLPADVVGLGKNVLGMATGGLHHTCAFDEIGALTCWGYNISGQVGNGKTSQQLVPTPVSGLDTSTIAVACGQFHTCALAKDGRVACWGRNTDGRLGYGSPHTDFLPVQVVGLELGAVSVSAGEGFSCAVGGDGAVKCWGKNDEGQLGDGTNEGRAVPAQVFGIASGSKKVSSRSGHSCAIGAAGGAKCWGRNISGQIGDGTYVNKFKPVPVFGSGVVDISAGGQHTCAIADTAVYCWGSGANGQLGLGTFNGTKLAPALVQGIGGAKSISAGGFHTCALNLDGAVYCWGANMSGQLGDGSLVAKFKPTYASPLSSGASGIAAAGFHTCAVQGGLFCWGQNNFGQLGNGSLIGKLAPTVATGVSEGAAKGVYAGESHTCAISSLGVVQCWGMNYGGQLGIGQAGSYSDPVKVIGLAAAVTVAAGQNHTCAIDLAGAVKCWGSNESGELGDGNAFKVSPVLVLGFGKL